MAGSLLQEFFVRLSGQTDNASFKEMGASIDGIGDKIKGFAQLALGVFASSALASAVQATADRFDAMGDVVSRMGSITAHEFEKLTYGAGLSGTDAEIASRSFENLANTLGQALNGVGRGAAAFEAFGLSARNAAGEAKSVPELIDDVRAKLSTLDSTAEKTAFLERLGMDRSMMEYLSLEADTLAELNAEYEARSKLLMFDGLEVEGNNVEQAIADLSGDFNDNLARMLRGINDIYTAFIVRLMPPLSAAFDRLARWFLENSQSLTYFFDPIAKAFKWIIDLVTTVIIFLLDFNSALFGVPALIMAIVAAWKLFNLAFIATPVGMIVTAIIGLIALVAVLYDDFKTFATGGDSLFNWQWLIDLIDKVKLLHQYLKDTGVYDALISAVTSLGRVFVSVFEGIYNAVKTIFGLIYGIFTGNFDTFKDGVKGLYESVKGFTDNLVSYFKSILTAILGLFNTNLNAVFEAFVNVFTKIKDAVSSLVNGMIDSVLGAFSKVTDTVKGVFDAVKGGIGGAFDSVTSFFTSGNKDMSAKAVPNNYSNVSSNSTVTNNQTFNVNSAQEASLIASNSVNRDLGQVF